MDDRYYETNVGNLLAAKNPNARIFYNQQIRGIYSKTLRQVDLIISSEKEKVAVECKFYSSKIDLKTVDSFIGFLQDIGFDRGLLITNVGASKSCAARIAHAKIEIQIINENELKNYLVGGILFWNDDLAALIRHPYGWTNIGLTEFASCTLLPLGATPENFDIAKESLVYLHVAEPGLNVMENFEFEMSNINELQKTSIKHKTVISDEFSIRISHLRKQNRYDIAIAKEVPRGLIVAHGLLKPHELGWTTTALKKTLSKAIVYNVTYGEDSTNNPHEC